MVAFFDALGFVCAKILGNKWGNRIADGSTYCVILVEEWESAELQALHLEQPHMKRLADIKPRYVRETAVEFIAEQRTSRGS